MPKFLAWSIFFFVGLESPTIKKSSVAPYTKITFEPDLEKFGIKQLSDDLYNLMVKRVYDICACTNVNVFLNEKKINCNGLPTYVNYYFDEKVAINDALDIISIYD